MLYKILDMLQHCQIKFVFLCTSMKLDIADSFEKRIKSRFSHRQVLLYKLQLKVFKDNLRKCVNELQTELLQDQDQDDPEFGDDPEVEAFEDIEELITSGLCEDIIRETYDNGK